MGLHPLHGGSAWQHINKRHSNGRLLIKKRKELFAQIWAAFEIVARRCWQAGGHIAIEWPRGCSYWHEPAVIAFLSKYDMQLCKFSGCSLGLVSTRNGLPIRKPWTVATTCKQLREDLIKHACPGIEAHPQHQPCEGRDTKLTENYTDEMVRVIHDAFRQSCSHSQLSGKCLPAFPACCAHTVGPIAPRGATCEPSRHGGWARIHATSGGGRLCGANGWSCSLGPDLYPYDRALA